MDERHDPAALAPRKAEQAGDETGWLIEAWRSRTGEFQARWWSLGSDGESDPDFESVGSWTPDSLKALRFAREVDAQAYIDATGWTEAKPTEHCWLEARVGHRDYAFNWNDERDPQNGSGLVLPSSEDESRRDIRCRSPNIALSATAEQTPSAKLEGEGCERCQGNGEIVTDWGRYLHPQEGDKGDEAVAECPDCGGQGALSPSPNTPQEGASDE